MNKFFHKIKQNKYWILAILVYSTLIYSTALHYSLGPEATMRPLDFYMGKEHVLKGTENLSLKTYFSDFGILSDSKIETTGSSNLWKSTSFWGDSVFYLLQTKSFDLSIPPYKYRFLPIVLVKLISFITGFNAPQSFVLMNVLLTIFTSLIFTYYLFKYLNFPRMISLIGGILFVTMVSNTGTITFPMLEPISFFFTVLIFIAVIKKNILLFILFSLCGVASKEILLFSAILWFVTDFPYKNYISLAKNLLISAIPIIGFMMIRIILGGAILEVSFGYNLISGELPKYGSRLFHTSSLLYLIQTTVLSFSFLWTGLINIRKNLFLQKSAIIIPFVIIAAFLLSGRIERIIGVLFPLVIPMFLFFIDKNYKIDIKADFPFLFNRLTWLIVAGLMACGMPFIFNRYSENPMFFGRYSLRAIIFMAIYLIVFLSILVVSLFFNKKRK